MAKKLLAAAILLIPLALVARLLWSVNRNRFVEVPPEPFETLLGAIPPSMRWEPERPALAKDAWPGMLAAADNTRVLPVRATEALDRALFKPESLGDPETMATLEEVFRRQRGSMSLISASVQKPHALVSEVEGGANPALRLKGLQALTTLLARRGTVAIAKGDEKNGVADLIASFRIGRRLYGGSGPIYYASLGSALIARSAREIRFAANRPTLSIAGLRRLLAELPTSKALQEEFKQSIRGELHWFVKNEVSRLRGPGGHNGNEARESDRRRDLDSGWRELDIISFEVLRGHAKPFDRRQTVLDAWPVYYDWIEGVDRSWAEHTEINERLQTLVAEWPKITLFGGSLREERVMQAVDKARDAVRRSRNPYGRLAIWFFLPLTEQNFAAPFRARTEVEATRLNIALRIFERERGRLPLALDELRSTGILAEVPGDPFGSGPFRYEPEKRRFWSVGTNGHDDGGADDRGGALRTRDFVYRLDPTAEVRTADPKAVAAEMESRHPSSSAR